MARDSRALTDQVDYFDELTEDQMARARLTVCANSANAAEATEMMMMLGIHPSDVVAAYLTGPHSIIPRSLP